MSHLGRVARALLGLAVVAGCSGSDGTSADDVADAPPGAASADSGGWEVVHVTDGDTLDVRGPEGNWTVRMVGINAPERGECMSDEATDELRALTADRDLVLAQDVSDVDQFGRRLRFVEAAGVDVGERLLELGLVLAREFPPDTSRSERYAATQAEARDAGVGLWAPDACGPAVDLGGGDIVIDELHWNAAGDDDSNLNDEWVRFTNAGSEPVDLDDWTVADESSPHRYTFHDVTVAPGESFTLFSGCGSDSSAELYWCSDTSVWTNGGDTVFLRDPNGNNVIAERYEGR